MKINSTVMPQITEWRWFDLESLNRARLFPIFVIVITLSASTNYYAGDLALSGFSPARWLGIAIIVGLFMLGLFLLDILVSFTELRNYRDPATGNIDIVRLWKTVYTNPLNGLILIGLMAYGITGAQSLSELYRVHATTWYDSALWALEGPFFISLSGSLLDVPKFWDTIYFSYWLFLMLVFCALYRLGRMEDLGVITIATVLSYYLTRVIALQFPTAGPLFYHPELFDLAGTLSDPAQKLLILYMQGQVPQNGFTPGTMGMPSLHIAVNFIAAIFIVRHISWTLWPSVTWFVLTWLSTIFLGWHYVLDGVGGILIALVSILFARGLLYCIDQTKNSIRKHLFPCNGL
ncbi:MAG: phosphatase PAP2 family protein [bacterium]